MPACALLGLDLASPAKSLVITWAKKFAECAMGKFFGLRGYVELMGEFVQLSQLFGVKGGRLRQDINYSIP